jgi:hypothetical protein
MRDESEAEQNKNFEERKDSRVSGRTQVQNTGSRRQ